MKINRNVKIVQMDLLTQRYLLVRDLPKVLFKNKCILGPVCVDSGFWLPVNLIPLHESSMKMC